MFKKYRILKWSSLFLVTIVVVVVSFGLWFKSLLPARDVSIETSLRQDLPYLSEDLIPRRGKILAVVTSVDQMGTSGKSTGYELSELARAYYTFQANGFEVDIASPKGGKPPVIIDDEDMGAYDFAFLNDSIAQHKTSHTLRIEDVVPADYEAIFFAGGKGAMFDFPNNTAIQSIVRDYYENGKVIGAVCHGPAALVNVMLANERPLLEGKAVSGFTNEEELLLIADAKKIFPFLLEDKILAQGARFQEGPLYLEKMSHDKNLITGQNPWSTWLLAETMIEQLGYTPKHRAITDEEHAIQILTVYNTKGKREAKEMIESLLLKEQQPVDRVLIAKHSIMAAMQGNVGKFFNLVGLVSFAKKCEDKRSDM